MTAIRTVEFQTRTKGLLVSGTIDFAAADPAPTTFTVKAGPITVKKGTFDITPAERTAAGAVQQALEGADIVGAAFPPATGSKVGSNTSRMRVGELGTFDVPLTSKGTVDASKLTPQQNTIATAVLDTVSAYMKTVGAFD